MRYRFPPVPLTALLLAAAALLLPTLATATSDGRHDEPDDEREIRVLIDAPEIDLAPGLHGYLGVMLLDLTPELLEHFGVDADHGVMVAKVAEESPAADAGLAAGDIVTGIDGEAVASSRDLQHRIVRRSKGDEISLEVWRDGKRLTLEATLDERPRSRFVLEAVPEPPEGGSRRYQFRFRAPDPSGRVEVFELDPERREGVRELLDRVRERLDDPEFRQRFDAFREHQQQLEKRLRELEQRLQEMQRALDRMSADG